MPSLLCMWVHNVRLCVKDCFSVPFTPWRSLVPWQCFPYMHITHVQTHTDTHYTEQSVKCGDEETMSLRLVTALSAAVITVTQGQGFLRRGRKEHLMWFHLQKLTMMASLSLSLSRCLSPPLSYLRQAEEAHSQEKMAWGDGRACVPGIPQYTVDTLLWHLQGQLDRYSVIRVWEKLVLSQRKAWLMFYHLWMHIKLQSS